MPRTLALLLALAAPAVVAAQGKLDAVRDAVEKSNPDSRPSDDSRSGDAPSPDEDPIAALFGGGSGDAFSSSVRFSVYPYASPDVPVPAPEGAGERVGRPGRRSRRGVTSTGSTGSACGCFWTRTPGSG